MSEIASRCDRGGRWEIAKQIRANKEQGMKAWVPLFSFLSLSLSFFSTSFSSPPSSQYTHHSATTAALDSFSLSTRTRIVPLAFPFVSAINPHYSFAQSHIHTPPITLLLHSFSTTMNETLLDKNTRNENKERSWTMVQRRKSFVVWDRE